MIQFETQNPLYTSRISDRLHFNLSQAFVGTAGGSVCVCRFEPWSSQEHPLHAAGVNGMALRSTAEHFELLTAGDDHQVGLAHFACADLQLLSRRQISAHCSAVRAVLWGHRGVWTLGLDRRLKHWDEQLELVGEHLCGCQEPETMAWQGDQLVLAGRGLELCRPLGAKMSRSWKAPFRG